MPCPQRLELRKLAYNQDIVGRAGSQMKRRLANTSAACEEEQTFHWARLKKDALLQQTFVEGCEGCEAMPTRASRQGHSEVCGPRSKRALKANRRRTPAHVEEDAEGTQEEFLEEHGGRREEPRRDGSSRRAPMVGFSAHARTIVSCQDFEDERLEIGEASQVERVMHVLFSKSRIDELHGGLSRIVGRRKTGALSLDQYGKVTWGRLAPELVEKAARSEPHRSKHMRGTSAQRRDAERVPPAGKRMKVRC